MAQGTRGPGSPSPGHASAESLHKGAARDRGCSGHRREEALMKEVMAQWSLILLCFSMAVALGGDLYESIVLIPLWSKSPPSSFAIIQPGTGVPLQRFWIPVHAAITLFIIVALVMTWGEPTVRRLLLVALVSYIVMRVWSGLFFIPEMLAFQKLPLDDE